MLKYTVCGSVKNLPILFLHGFLGSSDDWEEVICQLEKKFYCIAVHLPGHGSPLTDDFPLMLQKTLQSLRLDKVALVGYSMGGRLALMAAQKFPTLFSRLILISAHPGLHDEKERVSRQNSDLAWERLLKSRPLEEFLRAWYAQPLFNSLRQHKNLYDKILKKRSLHNPSALSAVLHMYGLAKLPAADLPVNTFFVCGEEDEKYAQLYAEKQPYILKNCGHALHLEQPAACAKILETILEKRI